jgi:hypothetical protein
MPGKSGHERFSRPVTNSLYIKNSSTEGEIFCLQKNSSNSLRNSLVSSLFTTKKIIFKSTQFEWQNTVKAPTGLPVKQADKHGR